MVILSISKGGVHMSYGYGNNFVLIVVLFILLIIVGATFVC
ncbi:YjcZ family sporulation protein [Pontibacillus salipaludis]